MKFISLSLALACSSTCFAADSDWASYLGDPGATHYSSLTQITSKNVAQLQPAWTFHTGEDEPRERAQIQCNPLVIDGVLYGTTTHLALFAIDAATGKELWRFESERSEGFNRGLAWWTDGDERRIMYSSGSFLYAIDPTTGETIESFGNKGRIDFHDGMDRDVSGLGISGNAPGAIYKDLIIVGMRVGEGPAAAAPGHIRAYDVRTGERRWIFHTIPHPGEYGYDTWPKDAWKNVGGANCWTGLIVDPESGTAFIPTGSASFDFWGGDRLGDNLFANTLIALDAETGKRKWHFQFVHHDIWDYDLPAPPVLCEVTRDGKKIAAVAQVTKTGHVWVFDRETGESLYPWEEKPVPPSLIPGERTAKTQPVPLAPAPFARQLFTEEEVTNLNPIATETVLKRLRELNPHQPFDPPSEKGTVVLPGFNGGPEWGGPAVDPQGILYVNSSNMAWILEMVPTAKFGGGVKSKYAQLCMSCHGVNREGNGTAGIADLNGIDERMSQEEIIEILRTGKGAMPSFDFISDDEKEDLARYLIAPNEKESAYATDKNSKSKSTIVSPYVTTGYNRFLDPEGYPALRPPWGTLNAIDLNTGEHLWKKTLGELPELTARGIPPTGTENYGGPIVTAGGVLFIGATNDEMFRAFDTKTGDILWETKLPFGGYATPATYEVDGRQYVVIACGGGKMGTKSGDAYVAFALPN